MTSCFANVDPETEGDDLVESGVNMGKGLNRLSHTLHGKLVVVIPKRKTRPQSALIAVRFPRQCNNALREHVPMRTHWNKYKGDNRLLCDYYGKVEVIMYCRPCPPVLFI